MVNRSSCVLHVSVICTHAAAGYRLKTCILTVAAAALYCVSDRNDIIATGLSALKLASNDDAPGRRTERAAKLAARSTK